MSLVSEIQWIKYHTSEVNPEITEQFLRALVNSYKKKRDYRNPLERLPAHPTLIKVIAGETTFGEEFKRLGPTQFFLQEPGNMGIFGGGFDLDTNLVYLDKTIDELYRGIRNSDEEPNSFDTDSGYDLF